jgi:hypothetical protein
MARIVATVAVERGAKTTGTTIASARVIGVSVPEKA